jgi:zinc protease
MDRGPRVLFVPDPSSPVLAVATAFPAGRRHEGAARGLAVHAARSVALASRGPRWLEERAGASEITLHDDAVTFVDTAPASELALALWTAAERLREAAKWAANQGGFVARAPTDRERLEELVLSASPETTATEPPFAERYRAEGAVVVLTGPFEQDEAQALVERYFGGFAEPHREARAPAAPTPLPEQTSRRSAFIERAGPRHLYGGFAVPGLGSDAHAPLELAALVLESRVRARLQLDGAARFTARLGGRTGVDLLVFEAELTPRGDTERLRGALERELSSLARSGPTAAELAEARARRDAANLDALASPSTLASTLARSELLALPAPEPLGGAPSPDAKAVARAIGVYLGPTRSTFVEQRPPPPPHAPKPPGLAEEPTPPPKGKPTKPAAAAAKPAAAKPAAAKPKTPNKPGARR